MNDAKTEAPITPQTRRPSRSSMALFAGFGALLILMAITCVDTLHTFETFETNNAQIRQDFLYRERTLEQVRANLYEAGNVISDYLEIESDPHAQQLLRMELQSIHSDTAATLNECIQTLPIDKKPPFQQLTTQFEKYWSTIEPILSAPQARTPAVNSALRSDVLSQHAEILAITKEVSVVNGNDLYEADRRMADVLAQFRSRLLMVAAIAFSIGLILAATTITYVQRLEKNVEMKYQESLLAQNELKELSRRLVDAEECERRAISRELHDEIGQSLSALLIDVGNLANARADGTFQEGLQNIKILAENCVKQVRNMALLLRPSMLDDLGLIPALEWQAREVSKRTGIVIDTVDENVSDNLPEEHRTCVYRVVQEALNNVSKHAYAKNVRVIVRQDHKQLFVSVEDDGKGFDATRVRGLGLVGMNERVSQLGGVLRVDSDPARGTLLRIDLPLPNGSEISVHEKAADRAS